MKKLFCLLLVSLPILAMAQSAQYYDLNQNTTVTWTGKKVTGEHTGTVPVTTGEIITNGTDIKSGEIVINLSELTCTDLKAGEGKEDLEKHLKSADFFNTAEFKGATLTITEVKADGEKPSTHTVKGELTIKGITEAVEFPATLVMKDNAIKGNAKLTFDRTKFGIKYNSGSFFSDLGDYMIYDDIVIDIVLSATLRE